MKILFSKKSRYKIIFLLKLLFQKFLAKNHIKLYSFIKLKNNRAMKKEKSNNTTFISKEKARENKQWFVLDAQDKTLGRFASEVAKILRGKHKPTFTPHVDTGDGVIVINAEKIKVTGSKAGQKVYHRYTGFMSGLRETIYWVMSKKKPAYIIEHAVKGMLPKTKLGRKQLKNLRVYRGEQHNMQAQKPIKVNI